MTRKDLEANLGRKMYLRLFDGEEITGILHKTNEERYNNIPNLHLKPNYYFLSDEVGNCMTSLFRVSHIATLLQKKVISDMYDVRGTTVSNNTKQDKITQTILDKLANVG